jgi:hypothetical protein
MPDSAGELVPADLASYTQGRLDAAAADTRDVLVAALAAARRFCRWHVTPVHTDEEIILDGPGSPLLSLPTQRMTGVTSIVEDGVPVDLSLILWSRAGKVRKVFGGLWTVKYSGIVATITHGFDHAEDFQRAVLSYADRLSLSTSGGRRIVVGPFQYAPEETSGSRTTGASSPFSAQETMLLSEYRLEGRP